MATTSPLRQRMIEDMTIRNLSPATQQSYIYAVRKFSRHFGASPDRLGIEDVRTYQLHLIAKKRSWSHINQAACALRFFYGVTMDQQDAFERIVNGREAEKLPPVLAPDEVARFLEAVVGLRNRVALTTAYAAGLRIGEVCRLKVASIDRRAKTDPCRMRQRREGPLRNAVAASARCSARLLAARASRHMAISRPRGWRSCQYRRIAGRLSCRKTHDEAEQARDGPLLEA
jgi:site-specific recombinase XerD